MYIRKLSLENENNDSVFLWGARQVGKTTLIRSLLSEMNEPHLFLDGDDAEQLDWALKFEQTQKIDALWILINGPVFELMARLNRVIYFDQGGKLVEKFGILQVPAVVRQEAKQFVVEELKLPDTIKEKT